MICLKDHDAQVKKLEETVAQLHLEVRALTEESAIAHAKLSMLEPEAERLREDNKKLIDRMLMGVGYMPLYGEPPKYVAPTGDAPKTVKNGNDIVKELQKVEDQAYIDERLAEGRAALAEAMKDAGIGEVVAP